MDTTSSNPGSNRARHALLAFGMLESYGHMGYYTVECIAGCICDGIAQQSAAHSGHRSDYSFVYLTASQHPACRLDVTSLPQTDSGEHKVKFDALMIGADIDVSFYSAGFYEHLMQKPVWTGGTNDQTAG